MKATSREVLLQTVREGRIASRDAEWALEFVDYYATTKGLSERSKNKYTWILRSFLEEHRRLGKETAGLTQKEAVAIIQFLQASPWTEDTRYDCWDRYTRFLKWADKKYGPFDPEVRELLLGDERYRYQEWQEQSKV